MRLALAFLTGWLLGACHPTTAPPASPSSTPSDIASQTVVINSEGSVCAGVWVAEKYILTAFHCMPLTSPMAVDYSVESDMTDHPAMVTATDEEHDLALIWAFVAPPHGIATLRMSPVVQGEFAQGMGHPLGLWYTYSTGIVSAVRDMDGKLYVQATTPVSPGCSGGGLFDGQGRLIGISNSIVGSMRHGQSLNMFVHMDYVRDFLKGKLP